MSYINYINKLSSDTKKVLQETSFIQDELEKYKPLFNLSTKYTSNSIGYKIKYIFQIDNELSTKIYLDCLKTILTFIVETYLLNNDLIYINYDLQIIDQYLCLSFFHKNSNYIENIGKNIVDYISKELEVISLNIRSKLIDISLPLKIKLKTLRKEYPILVDIICNIIKEENHLEDVENFVNSLIKLLSINDFNILKDKEVKLETLESLEDPINFLTNKRKNDIPVVEHKKQKIDKSEDQKIEKLEKNIFLSEKPFSMLDQIETVNDNLKQLFWHTLETKKSDYSHFKHAIIFILIIALLIYKVPSWIEKLIQFNKSNSVIDNILDLATEDLTTTIIKNKNSDFSKSINILETIDENAAELYEPNQPYEPSEPSECEDIGLITRNIIKKFNQSENTNDDLKSIESRLRYILEETDTKT